MNVTKLFQSSLVLVLSLLVLFLAAYIFFQQTNPDASFFSASVFAEELDVPATTEVTPDAQEFAAFSCKVQPRVIYDPSAAQYPGIAGRGVIRPATAQAVPGQKAFVVNYPAGYPTGGATAGIAGMNYYLSIPPGDRYYLEYDIYFAPGFDFVRGGKLPGLYGGQTSSASGGKVPKNFQAFSSRYMFSVGGGGSMYLYWGEMPMTAGGWFDRTPNSRFTGSNVKIFTPGRTHKLAQLVDLGTPGQNNGQVHVWVDGRLVVSRTDLKYRTSPNMKINNIFMSTFFGGNSPDWAPKSPQRIQFSNIRVLTDSPTCGNVPGLPAVAPTVTGGGPAAPAAPAPVLADYEVNDRVELIRNSNVRTAAALTGDLIGVNARGWRGTIVGGPVPGPSNTSWYRIQFDRNAWNGWVVNDSFKSAAAEVIRTPNYFRTGNTVKLFRRANVRSQASISTQSLLGVNAVNSVGVIEQGPVKDAANNVWYRINFSNAEHSGWVVSDNFSLQ